MHCADGTARMTLPRLVRTCGGTETFWRAVAAVGWLELDETAATVAVPGWDRRFSQAAKARAQQSDRSRAYEDRNPGRKGRAGPSDAPSSDDPTPDRRRGEDRRSSPSSPREASQDGWQQLRAAWNAGDPKHTRRRPWKPATAPNGVQTCIDTPDALSAALEAVERLPACRYFSSPVTLTQFVAHGFVDRVLGGQYDDPKQRRQDGQDAAPPAGAKWTDADRARFEATKRAMAERLRAAGGAA